MSNLADRRSALRLASRLAGFAVAIIGGSVLLGWWLDVGALRSIAPGLVEMKANTAACFVMTGLRLGLSRGRKSWAVSGFLPGAVIAVGLATVFEYLTGVGLGLDEFLFKDPRSLPLGLPPGRMAMATAVAFILTGAAMVLADRRHPVAAQFLTFAAVLIPMFALLAYLFGERAITLRSPYMSLAIHTAVAFAILGAGLLGECTGAGPMSVFVSEEPGGVLVRRLLPLSVGLMIVLGFSASLGARAGLYSQASGMILFAVVATVMLSAVIWANGWLLNRDGAGRRETTERLRRVEERLGFALGAGRMGTWDLDVGTGRLLCSDAFRANHGRRPGEPFEYEDLAASVVDEDRPAWDRAVGEAVARAVDFEVDCRVRWPDGSVRWVQVRGSCSVDPSGKVLALSGVSFDVTERKEAERELRGNDERKDEFLAMLAHELRNPLAAIGNAVRLTAKAGPGEDLDWSMGVIERQTRHLSRLIDDLMDVSRISRGQIELRREVAEITPILESAANTVGRLVEDRKHTLEFDVDRGKLWVDADPTRLEQVVVNLLNNAAKYSEDAGHILLSARREGGDVVVSVKDRGVGMPPGKWPAMFELFAQGDRSLARSEGGLGIGLTVVRKLVELHGGSIEARSEGPGLGSEFVVRLPAATPAGSRPAATRPEAAATGGKAKVLVVDDNADLVRGMARLLRLAGHEVATAHDGPAAIDAARRHRPEIVLLDIGLPGMSGYEVASTLRREDWCRGAVIVAVSGYGQDEDRRRSKEAGFDHHLTKPVDHDALLGLLEAGKA